MSQVQITAMTFGPYGIGKLDGVTAMVPNAAPGDLLDVSIESQRRDYVIARTNAVVRPGTQRRVPPCPYLPRCGGCDWQQITYAEQLRAKAELIASEIGRALKVPVDAANLIEAAPAEFGYRSRIRLKVGRRGELGFYELASNALVEVDRCLLAVDGMKMPRALASALSPALREIEVVRGQERDVLVAHLARRPRDSDVRKAERVMEDDRDVAGIVLRGGSERTTIGEPKIAVEIEPGLVLVADADAFTQVNHALNRRLIAAVMETAEIRADLKVLDFFCGVGNFSLPAARRGAEVTGVDADPLAVSAAQANAARLGLAKTRFIAMDAVEAASFLIRAHHRCDLAILDPPRTGALDLIESIIRLGPASIVYVSCDLKTLARDLAPIVRGGYRMSHLRAFDFFPNTHHVEVLAHLLLT